MYDTTGSTPYGVTTSGVGGAASGLTGWSHGVAVGTTVVMAPFSSADHILVTESVIALIVTIQVIILYSVS